MVAADQPGLEERVVGLVVRRDVPLLAVQDVVVAVPPRGGREVGDVGPGVLLGDGVALRRARRGPRAAATARAGTASRPPAARPGEWPCTRPSALVTRPPCSWTSTCWSVRAARGRRLDAGMFVAVRPSSRARARVPPPAVRASSTAVPARPRPRAGSARRRRLRARAWSSRSASVSRCIGASRRQPSLTDCSVYASVRRRDQQSGAERRTRWSSAAAPIGAWCAWFLKAAGLERVVLLEAGTLGKGASSRAAGMVRAQGGTEHAVRLGLWTRDFYASQQRRARPRLRLRRAGLLHALLHRRRGRRRRTRGSRCSRPSGSTSGGSSRTSSTRCNPAVAPGRTLGSSYAPGDGYIDPPRNVLAYTAALVSSGVDVREGTAFTGLRTDGGRVAGRGARATGDSRPTGWCSPAVRSSPRSGALAGAADPGRRGPAPGRRDRAAPRPRAGPAADGVRRAGRHLLAPGGGRAAVGDEQPRRAARRGPGVRPRLLRPDARPGRGLGAGHRQARAAPDLGGDDRLHARPPADPRAAARSTTGRSTAPSSLPPAATG